MLVEDQTLAGPGMQVKLRLVALSFLMLFLELALIRWAGSNNIHLAYFTNFVLLASFLGIGIGFMRARVGPDLFVWTPIVLALLVAFVLCFPVKFTSLEELEGARGMAALPRWLSLGVIFLLTVVVMACIGHGVARTFIKFPPLEAYRFDILGSIAGIVAITLLAFLQMPPIVWGVIVCVLLTVLIGRRPQLGALVVIVVFLAIESAAPNDHWSPYYKVTAKFHPEAVVAGTPTHDVLELSANNIPHQTAYPIETLRQIQPFYFFPYRHVAPADLERVLIVGAGNGNDVAVALAAGAQHIDAVEIDPVVQSLGERYHADAPYDDPRVSVHINDGRAFIEQSDDKYDLIMFALPDSLVLLAGQGSLRLENYLFTLQSMRTVQSHLAPGGTFVMYNYYEPFLLDRYAATLERVYGAAPCVEVGDALGGRQQAVITAGAGATTNCASTWDGERVSSPTDNYPFPYLETRSIPAFYWHTLLLMLAASLLLIRTAGGPMRGMIRYTDLAFMGAAFLLLETKNVVQFALLFGTTWIVNSLVFAGVLASVYAAIEVARHFRLPPDRFLYACLIAALGVAWIVPQSSLLSLDPVLRFVVAVALAFAPIFLANLIFAQRFQDVGSATTAFAANLLGAIVGGSLEYLALITGYRFLLVVVAVLYGLAFATRPKSTLVPTG